MKRTLQGLAASFAVLGVLSLAACDRQSSGDHLGDHLDDAGDHVRDAAESTGDAARRAGEEARDGIDDLGDDNYRSTGR